MIFNNPEFGQVRAVEFDGEPWMVGKDVAEALGYADTKSALADHVDAEDKQIIQRSENASLDIPNRGLTVINESGLYSLVLSSKLYYFLAPLNKKGHPCFSGHPSNLYLTLKCLKNVYILLFE